MAFVALPMAGWSLDQPRRWFSKETANGFSFSFEGRRPGWGVKHTSFRLDASFGHVALRFTPSPPAVSVRRQQLLLASSTPGRA